MNRDDGLLYRLFGRSVRRLDSLAGAFPVDPGRALVGPEGGPVPRVVESAIRRARGGGRPLPRSLREHMGARLGQDFRLVRIHIGPEASNLSRQLGARAFTIDSEIFFGHGTYDPDSPTARADRSRADPRRPAGRRTSDES